MHPASTATTVRRAARPTVPTVPATSAALLLLALVAAPTAARAQTPSVDASTWVHSDDGQRVEDRKHATSGAAAHVQLSGDRGLAEGSLSAGVAHLYAGSIGYYGEASAHVAIGTRVTVTNTTGSGASSNALQLFIDAAFFRTANGSDPWNDTWYAGAGHASAMATVTNAATGEQVDFAEADLFDSSPTPGQAMATVYLPRPATIGASATYILGFAFEAYANRGWTADFSNTAHLYLPTVDGIVWSAVDGAFAEQARPEWARNATVDYEVTPAATTAPEPATVGLLGVGLVGIGGAVREVRRER